eukprot:6209973-Pleurochrysis_carterae.AAC.1
MAIWDVRRARLHLPILPWVGRSAHARAQPKHLDKSFSRERQVDHVMLRRVCMPIVDSLRMHGPCMLPTASVASARVFARTPPCTLELHARAHAVRLRALLRRCMRSHRMLEAAR